MKSQPIPETVKALFLAPSSALDHRVRAGETAPRVENGFQLASRYDRFRDLTEMALFKDGLRAQLFSERVRGGFAVRSGR